MNVDHHLIAEASRLLGDSSANKVVQACAAYSRHGTLITGVSATKDEPSEAVMAVVSKSREIGDQIAALVMLQQNVSGTVAVQAPTSATLEHLSEQARRHAQIAVNGTAGGSISVRPLWELIHDFTTSGGSNAALLQGRFGAGMKQIAHKLAEFAKETGVPNARSQFADRLVEVLERDPVRAKARSAAPSGSKFISPAQLDSVSLRHAWLGFEIAAEEFAYEIIDSLRPELVALGCNAADVVHIKQGVEALRNIVSVLIVLTGTRHAVANECPFHPYRCH